jgi:hypothetical protein
MLNRFSAREKINKYIYSLLSGSNIRTYFIKKISLLEDILIFNKEEIMEKI